MKPAATLGSAAVRVAGVALLATLLAAIVGALRVRVVYEGEWHESYRFLPGERMAPIRDEILPDVWYFTVYYAWTFVPVAVLIEVARVAWVTWHAGKAPPGARG